MKSPSELDGRQERSTQLSSLMWTVADEQRLGPQPPCGLASGVGGSASHSWFRACTCVHSLLGLGWDDLASEGKLARLEGTI